MVLSCVKTLKPKRFTQWGMNWIQKRIKEWIKIKGK